MRIYVAAPWVHKEDARNAAAFLEANGHTVISRWLWQHDDTQDPAYLKEQANADLVDLLDCDAFVLLNLAKSEGKASELGMMIMFNLVGPRKIPLVVVGPREGNIFYHLTLVHVVPTLAETLPLLQ